MFAIVECDFISSSNNVIHFQVALHTVMLALVLVLAPSFWMTSSVLQVLASYWSALADQSCLTTACILLMLAWDVKVHIEYQKNGLESREGCNVAKV